MSQTYFALLTAIGEAKLANASTLGTPLQISRMAVGDGNGNLPVPNRNQTALVHETYRADLNELKVDPLNASQIIAELVIPEVQGGYWLREMGLYDAAGDLIAVSNCPPSYKPVVSEGSGRVQVMRMVLVVASTATVQLKIDPSIVLATRAYADAIMVTHLAAADPHPQYTTEAEVNALIAASLNNLDNKQSALYTTTANISLNGLAVQAGGDWASALPANARVLVKNQATAKDNGIYVAAAGAWARAADADASLEVTPGLLIAVEQGSAHPDSLWQLVTDGPITLGTTALQFEMAAGPTGVAGGTYDQVTLNARGQITGATRALVSSISTDTALTAAFRGVVLVNATGGDRTITLPLADANLGVMDVLLRRVDNSGNRLKVQAAGTDKIKFHTHLNAAGYAFLYLMGAGDYWHLRSDGAGSWLPLSRLDTTPLGRVTYETTTAFAPGGNGPIGGVLYNRAEWPWMWDHAQASGMLYTEALRAGFEGGWTSGDGAATFRSPDGRGEFARIQDDGRGVDKSLFQGTTTNGNNVITSAALAAVSIGPGVSISGAGIPAGTTVQSVNIAGSTVTLSANATASASGVVLTLNGRAPGTSQIGTGHNIDTGSSNAVLSDKVSGLPDPGISRTAIGLDAGDASKYNANAGYFGAAATSGGPFTENSEISWGVTRPRNIAWPGRMKLI